MRVKLSDVRPNPYRNFDLYPIDPVQVESLRSSIHDHGFWGGVTMRKVKGGYELAAGHHRIEAARAEGLTEIDCIVQDRSDADMVKLMTAENLSQRGYNASAVLDSVAATVRVVAELILSAKEGSSQIRELLADPKQWPKVKNDILKSGPGQPLICKFDDRILKHEAGSAIASLKASGHMASIIQEVQAKVQAKHDAEVEAERKATEAAIKAEEDAAVRKAMEKELALGEAKEAKAQAKIDENLEILAETDVTYDARCSNVFRLPSHERVFMTEITSDRARKVIDVDQQLALAKAIRENIDATEKKRNMDLGSNTIQTFVRNVVSHATSINKEISEEEKNELLKLDADRHINDAWKTIQRGTLQQQGGLAKLREEYGKWAENHPDEAPLWRQDIVTILLKNSEVLDKLLKSIGFDNTTTLGGE